MAQVAIFLDFEHSPEQVAARLGISHQSTYAHIMAERQAVCAMLKLCLTMVKTITGDNGKEFAKHQSMEREFNALVVLY